MFNYIVPPALLQPWVPPYTELDYYNGKCYVSLVGFRFWNTKLKGVPIPFHRNFEEINLRFYVKRKDKDGWKRGVVFIKEIVPRAALSFVANTLYNERYVTLPTRSAITEKDGSRLISYKWGKQLRNTVDIKAGTQSFAANKDSEEALISEHYWGYTQGKKGSTNEYRVEHPKWRLYPVEEFQLQCNFKDIYGAAFDFLSPQQPDSVLLAQGSPVVVFSGKKITT